MEGGKVKIKRLTVAGGLLKEKSWGSKNSTKREKREEIKARG